MIKVIEDAMKKHSNKISRNKSEQFIQFLP